MKVWTRKSTLGMSRREWLVERKSGIGGSDAGAVCGLNPYAGPMSVYRDKTFPVLTEEDNEAMRQGRDLEDYVAERFTEATGLKVRRSHHMYRSRKHPFMIADIDRLIVGEDAGLECKTVNAWQSDKWKDGRIPPHYLIQCQHYMAVTGKAAWYLAAVILGLSFVYQKIERDERLIENLVCIEKEFWDRHVVPRRMPPPDGSEICDEVLAEYFLTAKDTKPLPLLGFDERLERREEILALIEKLETEERKICQEIKCYMEGHESAVNDRYHVSWTNVSSTRLDTKRIREEQPELYQKYGKTINSRRFSIRAISQPAG